MISECYTRNFPFQYKELILIVENPAARMLSLRDYILLSIKCILKLYTDFVCIIFVIIFLTESKMLFTQYKYKILHLSILTNYNVF